MMDPEVTFTADLPSLASTLEFAVALGAALRAGDLVLLEGGLGAGTTTFVQGLARGMGLVSAVKSPTYTLVHEHRATGDGRPGLGHLDLYRIPVGRDLGDLGIDELLARGAVVVEWGVRLYGPAAAAMLLTLRGAVDDESEEVRHVTVTGRGERGNALAAEAIRALQAAGARA